jgi:membrane protease YdiL (CAAX protease family)
MIEAKTLLPFALAALGLYLSDNARRVKQLKAENTARNRAEFFPGKIRKQFLVIFLVPAICLWISNTLGQAFSPGLNAGPELAARMSALTGVSARDLWPLVSWRTLGHAALAVLALEAFSLVVKPKSPLALGDVSVLLPRSRSELLWCAVLAVIAGIGEELFFRGFIPLGIAGFAIPFDIALGLSVLLFAATHWYQGPIGVLATGAAGAALTAAYVLTDSLVFAISIHVAIDLVGLVFRPITRAGLSGLLRLIAQSGGLTNLDKVRGRD